MNSFIWVLIRPGISKGKWPLVKLTFAYFNFTKFSILNGGIRC